MSRFALKQTLNALPAVVLAAGVSGCVLYPEKQDFGDSVEHVTTMQVARPAMQPAPQDGRRARAVLEAYREDIGKPENIKGEMEFNVDSGR